MPRETFGARPLATVSTIHLGADSLRLEVLPAHLDVFTEYDYNSVSVKVHLYDAAANDFSPAHIFTIPSRNDKLRIVKYQLAHEYGLPPDGIRLFKESVASVYSDPVNSSGTVELFGDECVGFLLLLCFCESTLTLVHTRVCVSCRDELFKHSVWDGAVLYLEESMADPTEESPCQMEIERRKNELKISYRFGEASNIITMDRRDRVSDFKLAVARHEKCDVDSLVVFQIVASTPVQCRNEDAPLQGGSPFFFAVVFISLSLIDASRQMCCARRHQCTSSLQSRRGTQSCRRRTNRLAHTRFRAHSLIVAFSNRGERETVRIRFVLLAPSDARVPLFEEDVTVASSVATLKESVGRKLVELGHRTADNASQLRLREVEAGEVAGVLCEAVALKDAVVLLHNNKQLLVELTTGLEAVKTPNNILIYVRRFRGDYSLSPVQELALTRDCGVAELKVLVAQVLGMDVATVALARCAGTVSPLDLPRVEWNPTQPRFLERERLPEGVTHAPYYLRDGDTLVARDTTEVMHTLTDEQIGRLRGFRK